MSPARCAVVGGPAGQQRPQCVRRPPRRRRAPCGPRDDLVGCDPGGPRERREGAPAELSATSASTARGPTGRSSRRSTGPVSGSRREQMCHRVHRAMGSRSPSRLAMARGLSRVTSGRGSPPKEKGEGLFDGMSIKRALGFEAEMVTPTSTAPALGPRRPRHRADAASCSWCGSSFLSGPDLPPASRWSIGVLKVTWWYEHQAALRVEVVMTPTSSGQLLCLPPPPSPGRRRGVVPAVWSFRCCPEVPFHLRQAGCGPDPDHLRPKPSLTWSDSASGEPAATWAPIRVRRTGCVSGFPTLPTANRRRLGDPRPAPASRLGLGPRPGTGRADPERKQG